MNFKTRFVCGVTGERRSQLETLHQMKEAESIRKPVCGVKGISVLVTIPLFDIISSLPVDVMHNVFLGVGKGFGDLFFDSKNNHKDYYIGRKINEVNERLLKFNSYTEISRHPRQITQRHQWKANEWLNWMLYYAFPSLLNILPIVYLKHLHLLVSSITQLLQDDINEEKLKRCEINLKSFVDEYEMLYGKKKMVYNIHLLLHLVDSARKYGPLWAYSLFPYENMNGFLKKCIKGPNEPLLQVNNKYIIMNKVHQGLNDDRFLGCSDCVINFCENMLSSGSRSNVLRNSKYIIFPIVYFNDDHIC